jgi:hypothetical protein
MSRNLLEFNIIEEDFPMPVIESICIPVSNDLTCAETAIITKMASYPDADNCTAEKMHSMFLGSSYDEIKATLEGLKKNGYLIKNADVYSLNRSKLPEMVRRTISF